VGESCEITNGVLLLLSALPKSPVSLEKRAAWVSGSTEGRIVELAGKIGFGWATVGDFETSFEACCCMNVICSVPIG